METENNNSNQNFFSEGEQEESNLNLRHYWHIILERRWLIIATFITVFILALIYIFKAPKIYRATARLEINREYENVLNVSDGFVADSRETDYLQTQYKNLLSRSLIEQISNKLRLGDDPRYAEKEDQIEALMKDIIVSPIRLTRLVDVSVEHTDPSVATNMATTLVSTFIQNNLNRKIESSLAELRYLETEANSAAARLSDAENQLQRYKSEFGSISLDKRQDIVLQSLSETESRYNMAAAEASAIQTIAEEMEAAYLNGVPLTSLPQVASDSRIATLQTELAKLNSQLESLLDRYLPKYPAVQETQKAIDSINQSIETRAKEIYTSVQIEAAQKRKTAEDLKGLAEDKQKEALTLDENRVGYELILREAESAKSIYDRVLERKEEVNITSKSTTPNMRLEYAAALPFEPVKPRIILTLLLGIVGGCAAGVGLAFFVNYLDDSIKTQDDVETYLKQTFLGYIPNIKTNSLVERDLQSHIHPQSSAAEAFRTLRATISLMPKAKDYQVLAMTSTIPSEGKSLVASNLAVVLAQTGLKTVLIDADLRRPSVHKAFQLHSPIGLSSLLSNQVTDETSIIHKSEVPNLDIVCCGAIPDTPSELIGSKKMEEFLDSLRGKYDRIVLDCPPISAVSDPLILAARANGIIFVNKFNKIRREHARRSVQRIQDAGIHILGVVINDIDFEGKDSYYYSYYYYQNRYYASHYRSAPTDKIESKSNGKSEKASRA